MMQTLIDTSNSLMSIQLTEGKFLSLSLIEPDHDLCKKEFYLRRQVYIY